MTAAIPLAARSSSGIRLALGPPEYRSVEEFAPVQNKSCRCMLFSPDGHYFAYVTGTQLKIVKTDTWSEVAVIENVKAYHLAFSPKSTYLTSWEPFTVSNANPQGSPNLNIYKSETGELVKNFVHKKQSNWEPQWTSDEKLFTRLVNSDVVFYEDCNFERIVGRLNCVKVSAYSVSPALGSYFVLSHTAGAGGQPSLAKLFKYPSFDGQQALASKSFFQADRVEFYWNSKGSSALLLTSTEVDKTGGSYYGKQGLHFVGTNGQTAMVTLGKEGPIYSVAWSPKNQEFCVVYGFMPAKATIFNLKCESVFEFGTGPRNSIYYNPHGNILLLGGFGNLRGQVEIWNMNSRTLIGKCDAPDSTTLHWSPDGMHFMTATTAPRLRISNGYKIWHFSGSLLFEKHTQAPEELYEVAWKNFSPGTFKEPAITSERVEGIAPSQPQASKQVYRPPSARNRVVNFKLHDDDEVAHKPGGDATPSKAALKQRKKREARKVRKQEEADAGGNKEEGVPVVSGVQVSLTGDPEKDKKIKNIKRKLDAIEKLKQLQVQGKPLEINQVAKIKGESELLKELEELQV